MLRSEYIVSSLSDRPLVAQICGHEGCGGFQSLQGVKFINVEVNVNYSTGWGISQGLSVTFELIMGYYKRKAQFTLMLLPNDI